MLLAGAYNPLLRADLAVLATLSRYAAAPACRPEQKVRSFQLFGGGAGCPFG